MLGLGGTFLGLDSSPTLAAGTSWLSSIILLRLCHNQHLALACVAALSLSALSAPVDFTSAWVEDDVEPAQAVRPPPSDDATPDDVSDLLGVAAGSSGAQPLLDDISSEPVHW